MARRLTLILVVMAAALLHAQPAPVINSFTAVPVTIASGGSSTLSWSTSNTSTVTLSDGSSSLPVALSGSVSVNPPSTKTYTLTATNAVGSFVTQQVTVTVAADPVIDFFSAVQTTISAGQSTTLQWSTSNAANVTIQEGASTIPVALSGSVVISPASTATYTLTATNAAGVSAAATVTVTVVPLPVIDSFAAAPLSITEGDSSILSWSTSNAATVTIDNGLGVQAVNGSTAVSPAATTTYVLTATNAASTTTTATVTVTVVPPPVIDSFTATPATIAEGGSSTLSWATTGAASVTIDNGLGSRPTSGSVVVNPAATTTYTLTAHNSLNAAVTHGVTITVAPPSPQPISLQVLLPGETNAPGSPGHRRGSPRSQVAGTPFTVTVHAVYDSGEIAATVTDTIIPGSSDAGATLPPAAAMVAGTVAFEITLHSAGTHSISALDHTDPMKAPGVSSPLIVEQKDVAVIAVASFPAGLLARPGSGGASDQYVLVNIGRSPTTITLAQSGDFFTQAPATFTLVPGASQTVTLTAASRTAGSYRGSSIPSGGGVPAGLEIPVRLLVAAAPSGTPDVEPILIRIDTNEAITTGSAAFRNVGTASADGIVISDVPWIIPQADPLSIAPGETETASFTIDRSLRPDGDRPFGSQTARLRFRYFDGASRSTSAVLGADGSSALPTVTLVDTAGPRGTPGAIPPFAAGEIGRFLLGVTGAQGAVADVSLVNAGPAVIPGFNLYFLPAGASSFASQIATVGQVPSNIPFGLGDVLRTIFQQMSATGSLQVRARAGDVISMRGVLLRATAGGTVGTPLATFRSDLASPLLDHFLTGLRKDASVRTDLHLHEITGASASVQIEFFDENGTRAGAARPPDVVGRFSMLHLPDVVPPGAVLARISSVPGSAGAVVAEARVIESNGDTWSIIDASRQSGFTRSEPMIIPLAFGSIPASATYLQTDLVITNTSAAAASGTVDYPAGGRRRAVGHAESGSAAKTRERLSFAPMQTRVLANVLRSAPGRASITFTPEEGEFVISSRTHAASPAGNGTIGTSVPQIALSAAMRAGEKKEIAGLEDASAATVAAATPGTYRTSLGLVETAGKDVTLRLTLRFRYPLSLVNAIVVATREMTVGPHQYLVVDGIGRAIIGAQRDGIGDLHNLQLGVEVAGGDGRIIPFAVSTDNGSGDIFYFPF